MRPAREIACEAVHPGVTHEPTFLDGPSVATWGLAWKSACDRVTAAIEADRIARALDKRFPSK